MRSFSNIGRPNPNGGFFFSVPAGRGHSFARILGRSEDLLNGRLLVLVGGIKRREYEGSEFKPKMTDEKKPKRMQAPSTPHLLDRVAVVGII